MKNSKNEQRVERVPAEGTPFTLTRWENEWLVMLGDYVLLRGYKTAQEAEIAIEDDKWTLIAGLVYAVVDAREKQEKFKEAAKKSGLELI